jgi:hypothetical protein
LFARKAIHENTPTGSGLFVLLRVISWIVLLRAKKPNPSRLLGLLACANSVCARAAAA